AAARARAVRWRKMIPCEYDAGGPSEDNRTMARSAADWLAEGDAHYDAQRWREAGEAFERALALAPGPARAWYRLGNVREEQGRDTDAAACFEKALALDPS